MPPPTSVERARALQEQNEKRDLKGQIQTLTAQIQALQIQLGAAKSETGKAVVDAVAQANLQHDVTVREIYRQYHAETVNATRLRRELRQEKDDEIQILKDQVETLQAELEEWENAAPAPADAMAVDGHVLNCAICFADSAGNTMLSCGLHHICRECFGEYLDGKIATGCVAPVTCQATTGGCGYVFPEKELILVDVDRFLAWKKVMMDIKDQQIATAQKQLRESVFKIVESVEEARQYIIREILTTKCPKPGCGQVFLEFEGCAALICSNANCSVVGHPGNPRRQTNFCAWCGKAWGNSDEMHRHIIYCSMNPSPGQFFPVYGMDTYLSVLRKRQRDEIKQYLRAQQESVGLEMIRQILVACQQDISQCGIEEIEYIRL